MFILTAFIFRGKDYGVYHDGGISFADDPIKVLFSELGLQENEKFIYEYDFGDDWVNELRIEKILKPDNKFRFPKCI